VNHVQTSIIIPVYNAARDLPALIEGVRATSLLDYEILVVDDASTDGTAAACRKMNDVRLVVLEDNAGPARARNVGASLAQGEILIFLDSDVILARGADVLREMVDGLRAGPGADYAVTLSDIQPLALGAVSYNYSVYHAYYMERLLEGKDELRGPLMFFTTRLGAIWREKFRQAGGFYDSLQTVMNEDGEFGARCYHLGYSAYCRAGWVIPHRFSKGFGSFLRNYFLSAMVQAFISAKMDTSPDPSVAAPEKLRRVLVAALLASPLLGLWLTWRQAFAFCAAALVLLLMSLGRLNALVWRHVPPRFRFTWYLVYIAITPAILLGYLYGGLLHLIGRSPLKGRPSQLDFFKAAAA
jgi:glycosyltransferase involved in cell wall biosynthesis